MKTFECVRDVFENIRRFHEQTGRLYREMSDRTQNARAKMLLSYMTDHERSFDRTLTVYQTAGTASVLNTFFQFTTEETPDKFIANLDLKPDPTADDVVEICMKFDQYLECLFEQLAAVADAQGSIKVREALENLVEMELEAKKKLAYVTNSIWRDVGADLSIDGWPGLHPRATRLSRRRGP